MIELTKLNGTPFVLNCELIEKIEQIPETKITLQDGKYYLVCEDIGTIIEKVINYHRQIFRDQILKLVNYDKEEK